MKSFVERTVLFLALTVLLIGSVEGSDRVYENRLTPLVDPEPILADHPNFFQPIVEANRYEAPILVDERDADLEVRAWRWSYNARGIIEMPNRLRADATAIMVVHPWAIEDSRGWRSPEPAGVAFCCTPIKNRIVHDHVDQVVNPFLKSLRGKVKFVAHSLPGVEDPVRAKIYRSLDLAIPSEDDRREGADELAEVLGNHSYEGKSVPEEIKLSEESPVRDYFRQFPGLDSGDHYNGSGFWDLPVPALENIEDIDQDLIVYDREGYEKLRDTFKAQRIRHVLMAGYNADMCYISTTAGWQNLSKDFNVFLVGDATIATFPANDSPRYATNAAISFASLNQLVTQVSWIRYTGGTNNE